MATPQARNNAGVTYDEARGAVVVFGGVHWTLNGNTLIILPNWVASNLADTWTWTGSSWTEQHPANSPSPRSFTTMAYDPKIGKVVLFGGWAYGLGTIFGDTWTCDGTNWTQLTPYTSPPPEGYGSTMAYDPEHDQLVLFGGNTGSGAASDTWIFDGTNWTPATPASSPPARVGDASLMTYVPANHGLILFGGSGNTLNDTWLWNGTTWGQLAPATSPPASSSPALAYDAANSIAVLYRFEGETWTWDGQNWQKSTADSPAPRYGEVYGYHAAIGKVLMYGGVNFLPGFDDEYLWDGASWTQVDLGDRFPPQRTYNNQMAFDTLRDQALLFSAVRDGSSFLRDTWIWNGASWKWLHPRNNPGARAWGSMAYDPLRKVSVMFGGRIAYSNPVAQYADTWTFDGINWNLRTPALRPIAREGAPMAFDSVSGKIILFGGGTGLGTVLGDTWSWDGTNWTQEQPLVAPPARVYHTMAHDNLGRPLMFGGEDANGTRLGDSWVWNATSNTWQPAGAGPEPRFGVSSGFDASSQSIILFGGDNGTVFQLNLLNDTWAFDGTVWQPLAPAKSPSQRAYSGMASGSTTNPPVLMGGGGYVGPENAEAWVWGTPIAPPVQLSSVVSRLTHGTAGPFDVDLTNGNGIECRSGGASGNYTLVFRFADTLTTVGGATVANGTGSVSSSNVDGNDAQNYIVNLTGVTNAQSVWVILSSVRDSAGHVSNAVSSQMGVLLGDVNASSRVDAADVSAVRQQTLQPITSSNFREDINASGRIDAADVSIARQQTLTSLP